MDGVPTPVWYRKKIKTKTKKKIGKVNSLVTPKVDEQIHLAHISMSIERENLLSSNETSKSAINKKLVKPKIRGSKKADFPNEVSGIKKKIKKKRILKKKKKLTAEPSKVMHNIVNDLSY